MPGLAGEGEQTLGSAFPAVELASVAAVISHSPAEIHYRLSAPCDLGVNVYDVMGRWVASLLGRSQAAGEHEVTWDGRSDSGSPVASGHYFVVFASGGDLHATALITVVR